MSDDLELIALTLYLLIGLFLQTMDLITKRFSHFRKSWHEGIIDSFLGISLWPWFFIYGLSCFIKERRR
jgi:hypothetical protein